MKKWYPRKKNSRYSSPVAEHDAESVLFGTVPSLIKTFVSRWRRKKGNPIDWLSPDQIPYRSEELCISWIGHATFLIQVAGKNILTDPVFGDVSIFFPRMLEPGIQLELLPTIDYVLISHNHWDHLDLRSLRAIRKNNPGMMLLVPEGNKKWLEDRRFSSVHEYSWWQSHEEAPLSFCFVPSLHWSARGLFDRNKTLWGSWVITVGDRHIYFAGDTAYGEHFVQIGKEFQSIEVALIPIGPCEPQKWMQRTHTSGVQAIRAFHDLKARHFIPMHWGTFPFGEDAFEEPIIRLKKEWSVQEGVHPDKKLHILKAGKSFRLD